MKIVILNYNLNFLQFDDENLFYQLKEIAMVQSDFIVMSLTNV